MSPLASPSAGTVRHRHRHRHRPGRRRLLGTALSACTVFTVCTALAVLTGCSSHGAAPGAPSVAAGSTRTAPAATAPLNGSGGPSATRTPTRPDAELTPATGSFTAKEKTYLHGRVPQNADPAAVLQLGQEACERVARTARHDRDAAVGAVITGDVPGARDAIEPLCPDQLPVLRAARGGFPDGTRKAPAAGRYRALTPSPSCTWRAVGAAGQVLASGSAHKDGGGSGSASVAEVRAEVPSGTREFVSSGCYAWARDD